MTDTEFKELDLNKEVSDMEGDEARETLVDFMQAHRENREAYDAVISEFEDELDQVNDEKEELEQTVSKFKDELAEEAAEVTNFPADLIKTKFSLSEIETVLEEAEEAGEFSDSSGEEEEEEEPSLTTFSEKPEKGKRDPEDTPSKYRDTARALLGQHGVPVREDE